MLSLEAFQDKEICPAAGCVYARFPGALGACVSPPDGP
jgi:hypothetical protein